MKGHITMQLGDSAVKFTPDGKVSVFDAINALSASREALHIWQSLKQNQQEIADLCQRYDFQDNRPEPVVDSNGWEQIEAALLNYMLTQDEVG